MSIKININEIVKVELTKEGIKVLLEYSKDNGAIINSFNKNGYGYHRFTLWQLMEIFGSNEMSKPLFKNNNIEIN